MVKQRRLSASAAGTAISMQHPMWVMPMFEFVKLSKLEPHQKLRAEAKLVERDRSMKHVFFLSHQWTSLAHPDPSCEQLRAMQRVFLRMMTGILPKTSLEFTDAAYMRSVHQITSKEWATIVSDAYIWMEYAFATAPPNMHSSTHPLSHICMFS
jgi:hypothetical protein